jgi:hypothetical protein
MFISAGPGVDDEGADVLFLPPEADEVVPVDFIGSFQDNELPEVEGVDADLHRRLLEAFVPPTPLDERLTAGRAIVAAGCAPLSIHLRLDGSPVNGPANTVGELPFPADPADVKDRARKMVSVNKHLHAMLPCLLT